MNVITSNLNKNIIDNLTIPAVKKIDGVHDLKGMLGQCVNLYFNKMIIDITSIENYENIEVMKQLVKAVDPNRIILLTENSTIVNNTNYTKELINMGLYNFTQTYEGLLYLYEHPNTYENVKHFLTDNINNIDDAVGVIPEIKHVDEDLTSFNEIKGKKVIGIVNLTEHAGATTLVNMLTKHLRSNGIEAYGLEMNKQDLSYYREEYLNPCFNRQDLEREINKYGNKPVFIDLNDYSDMDNICDKIIYLIEPSSIKLKKLLMKNKNAFLDHKQDLIVLNQSFVSEKEIPDFEYETKLKVFYNIPPINDRDNSNGYLMELLKKLGL